MTVKELIEALKKFDESLRVHFDHIPQDRRVESEIFDARIKKKFDYTYVNLD